MCPLKKIGDMVYQVITAHRVHAIETMLASREFSVNNRLPGHRLQCVGEIPGHLPGGHHVRIAMDNKKEVTPWGAGGRLVMPAATTR